jgi:Arc/MetJ-type ribon-helix-helix transcriptional regulator
MWMVIGCFMAEIFRLADSEKLTLNIGYVDLGRIDLLVREGFYGNRSDFIRTAIRNQLSNQSTDVAQSVARNTFDLGLREFGRKELEVLLQRGERLSIKVVGLARIAPDVTGELAATTIEAITVLGALQASEEVKLALAGRINK